MQFKHVKRIAGLKSFKKRITFLLSALIFLIAFVLRVYDLGDNPPGVYRDEAAIGNLAYSVFSQGPVFPFKGLGGREMFATYVYSMLPFVKIFGLNALGIRMASAVYGSLTVLVLFLVARKMFNEKIALISSLLLSLSPIHLLYSRGSFEVIALPFYFLVFLYLLLRGIENRVFLLPSFLSIILAYNSYATSRIFMPLFLVGFILTYRKKIFEKGNMLFFILLLVSAFLALILNLYSVREVSTPQLYLKNPAAIGMDKGPAIERLLNYSNKLMISASENAPLFKLLYIKCFSYNFLFSSGYWSWPPLADGPSMLYTFYLPLLLLGIPLLLLKGGPAGRLVVLWLIVSPIPNSLTNLGWDEEHARRLMSNATPVFEIISAYALFTVLSLFAESLRFILRRHPSPMNNPKNLFILMSKCAIVAIILLFTLASFYQVISFLAFKFSREPYLPISQQYWCYPAKEALLYAESVKKYHDNIIVSPQLDTSPYGFVESFLLFYSKSDMGKYQICTSPPDCYKEGRNLYILAPNEIPQQLHNTNPEKIIYYSNKDPVFFIYSGA